MLPSYQDDARANMKAKEAQMNHECETQLAEVRLAKFKFFKAALKRDQHKVSVLKGVPFKINRVQHLKELAHRAQQAERGDQCVQNYINMHLRLEKVEKVEHVLEKITTFTHEVALFAAIYALQCSVICMSGWFVTVCRLPFVV